MKKLNSHINGNISTELYQVGPNSWKVTQSIFGKQLMRDYFLNEVRATQEFNKLTK